MLNQDIFLPILLSLTKTRRDRKFGQTSQYKFSASTSLETKYYLELFSNKYNSCKINRNVTIGSAFKIVAAIHCLSKFEKLKLDYIFPPASNFYRY